MTEVRWPFCTASRSQGHLGADPEVALRGANAKFERRFRAIETAPGFAGLSLEQKEMLWQAAKADQRET